MKIAVAGLGYVGLANAVMFAGRHDVVGYDIDASRVAEVNAGNSPIQEEGISVALRKKGLKLRATTDAEEAFRAADYIVVATPTDFDDKKGCLTTGSVEQVIELGLQINPAAVIVLRSTLPMGFAQKQSKKLKTEKILSSPEFLREGTALYDCLNPSRIVVGGKELIAADFAKLLLECGDTDNPNVALMSRTEAEAVKLFSNGYLAMRVAYFNELDSYALAHGLDARAVIEAVGMDPRIGSHHNNPSFGYGGYCLPKDAKQLASSFDLVPQSLLGAIVEANEKRKSFITKIICEMKPKRVGIYRLLTKSAGDNFRDSAILDILDALKTTDIDLVVYEPLVEESHFHGVRVEDNLGVFKEVSDLIVANRRASELDDCLDKVLSRDIFSRD